MRRLSKVSCDHRHVGDVSDSPTVKVVVFEKASYLRCPLVFVDSRALHPFLSWSLFLCQPAAPPEHTGEMVRAGSASVDCPGGVPAVPSPHACLHLLALESVLGKRLFLRLLGGFMAQKEQNKIQPRASLVAQWLRICLLMQGKIGRASCRERV